MTEIDFISALLPEVSRVLMERYAQRDRWQAVFKSDDGEMVTAVDTEVQDLIVSRLERAFPGDRIVGEEGGLTALPTEPSGRCWVVDPLDGTHNFIRALLPIFGTSIGFVRDGEPVAGGIALAATGDLLLAEAGAGTRRNGQPLTVSDTAAISDANASLEFCRLASRDSAVAAAGGVLERCREVRAHGAAVLALGEVAAGLADLFIHPNLQPWDYAAGMLIVTEAGGAVSRLDGRPVRLFDGATDLLATNGHLHDEALSLIAGT